MQKPQVKADLSVAVESLRSIALFSDIRNQAEVIEGLAARMVEKTFQPGQAMIREGEPGAEFYILVEGEASVHRRTPEGDSYQVATLEAKKHVFFGEGALLDSDQRSATIEARTLCRCLVLSRAAFEEFSKVYPHSATPIVRQIARAVLARLRKSNDDLLLLYKALIAEVRGS